MQTRSQSNIKGIDISNWQGNVDFAKVKNDGVKIVYIKSSEGTNYRDKYLDQNYNRAKEQGLKVGFYHFFRGNAIAEARYFVNCLKGKTSDCLLALDIESTNGMNKTNLTTACIEFLEEVKRLTGKGVVVYTYTSFAKESLDTRLSKYLCWIAEYGVNVPKANPIWSKWVGFQYSEKGKVNGVNGNCDMNEFTEGIFMTNKEEKKVKYLVVYNNIADERAAGYLADFLNCPTIWGARKFDYSCVENVIGVGGTKDQYTSRLTKLISGNTRYNSMEAVLDYIKKGN